MRLPMWVGRPSGQVRRRMGFETGLHCMMVYEMQITALGGVC